MKFHLFSAGKSVKRIPKPTNALMPAIHLNELVWAYVRGSPYWPGVVEEMLPNGKYSIHFFGDYTKFPVSRHNIITYFDGFNQFSCNFGNMKLHKAVEEAKIFLFDAFNPQQCYVCKMTALKKSMRK